MVALLALIPEILATIMDLIGAGAWWQLPVLVGLWKVQDQLTSQPAPRPGQPETPSQAVANAATQAASGVGQAVGGTGQAVGNFGSFLAGDGKWVVFGFAALILVTRR